MSFLFSRNTILTNYRPISHLSFLSELTERFVKNRLTTQPLIHSKLDYCNSLFLSLPQSHLGRLQLILNSSARAVSKTPKFAHIYLVLKSLQWLKIEQRIQYKVASITYKVLQSERSCLTIGTCLCIFGLCGTLNIVFNLTLNSNLLPVNGRHL